MTASFASAIPTAAADSILFADSHASAADRTIEGGSSGETRPEQKSIGSHVEDGRQQTLEIEERRAAGEEPDGLAKFLAGLFGGPDGDGADGADGTDGDGADGDGAARQGAEAGEFPGDGAPAAGWLPDPSIEDGTLGFLLA